MEEKTVNITDVGTSVSKFTSSEGGYKYFDKYRMDIDTVMIEVQHVIKETTLKRIQDLLAPPSPPEIAKMVPLKYQNKKELFDSNINLWYQLEQMYTTELKKKSDEWPNKYNTIKYHWDEVQDTIVKHLKHKQNYESIGLQNNNNNVNVISAESKTYDVNSVTLEQILLHSEILDHFTITDTISIRDSIEKKISNDIEQFCNHYKADVHSFLDDWHLYRLSKIKHELLSKYKVKQLRTDEQVELDRLGDQYNQTLSYFKSVPKPKEKEIKVICNYGGYDFTTVVKINSREKIKNFIQKYLVDSKCKYDKANEEPVMLIVQGPKLLEHLSFKDYNLSIIDVVQIVIMKRLDNEGTKVPLSSLE